MNEILKPIIGMFIFIVVSTIIMCWFYLNFNINYHYEDRDWLGKLVTNIINKCKEVLKKIGIPKKK